MANKSNSSESLPPLDFKIPEPPALGSTTTATGFFEFLRETKSRFFQAFVKKPIFMRPPSKGSENNTLNHPFRPFSSCHCDGDAEDDVPDIEALKKKVDDLESDIINSFGNPKDETPPTPSTTPRPEVLGITPLDEGEITYGGMPPELWYSIMEVVSQLAADEAARNNKYPEPPPKCDGNTQTPSPSNKERNMRYEVLKWNKN